MKKINFKFTWKGKKIIWYPIQTIITISTIIILLWTIITTYNKILSQNK